MRLQPDKMIHCEAKGHTKYFIRFIYLSMHSQHTPTALEVNLSEVNFSVN